MRINVPQMRVRHNPDPLAQSGGVMPQKSTDFYPKLLSGVTIYQIES